MAEFLPPHALDDVPWDRPAEQPWPDPDAELDGLTWNERWNKSPDDPDYPLPPEVERVPVAVAAAAAGTAPRARFGRPIRSPEDVELDDPYDEFAPLADDLQAPGQLTWTGGTVPLRTAASLDGIAPHRPSPPSVEPPTTPATVEPPTWSRSPRSVFGDYFGRPGTPAPSLPSPDLAAPPRVAVPVGRPEPKPESDARPVEEWPPVPTDFKPQWASVTPIRPLWSPAPEPAKPAEAPAAPPTWVLSTPAPAAPPPTASAPASTTSSARSALPPTASFSATRPLPPVRPAIAAEPTTLTPVPILPDHRDAPAAVGKDASDEDEEGGPSTAVTLFWMAVTGIVVVGLVLAFLHFLTGVFR